MTGPVFWRRAAVATLLMLLALSGTAALGVWQYTVAHRDDVSRAVLQAPPVNVTELVQAGDYVPESAYGRAVTANGVLDCERSYLAGQLGRTAPWLVCPLQLPNGQVIATVLGMQPVAAQPINGGSVQLTGRLQPAQSSEAVAAVYVAAPQVDYITTADSAMRWQTDVLDGYLLVDAELSDRFGLIAVPRAELVLPPAGIQLRNLFYAWQWWIFAGFAVFIWARYLRDERNALRRPAAGSADLGDEAG